MAVKLALLPGSASAHVAEQGFVLLLPTEAYSTAGVAVVALTVLVLFAVPANVIKSLFQARRFRMPAFPIIRTITSLLALILLAGILYVGVHGPRDPLSNLMPLVFWTLGWIGLVSLAGLLGDLWRWINPWTGLYRLLGEVRPLIRLPPWLGVWPATCLLIAFSAFLLADIAPDDPARLAYFVGVYWFLTMVGLVLCGPVWLRQVELGSVIFSLYARLAPSRLRENGGVGGPGWRLLEPPPIAAGGLFALTLLAVGSFDGVNETFWWLAKIGINPLAFPGRSAVVWPTILGLVGSIILLIAVFAVTVWLGLTLARSDAAFSAAFARLAQSLLPIALAYHIAHYLTAFLVNSQYALAAISDPLATGADLLGIEPFFVTTGFFNHIDSVRVIWLTQAGAVVIGHVWSVLLAHRMALDLFADARRAALATLPLSLFMIAYTMLGLWLLATPRGA
ncbi:MAG: hypothetical protein AAGC99_16220 [Pseudomonadota bacterium]